MEQSTSPKCPPDSVNTPTEGKCPVLTRGSSKAIAPSVQRSCLTVAVGQPGSQPGGRYPDVAPFPVPTRIPLLPIPKVLQ